MKRRTAVEFRVLDQVVRYVDDRRVERHVLQLYEQPLPVALEGVQIAADRIQRVCIAFGLEFPPSILEMSTDNTFIGNKLRLI